MKVAEVFYRCFHFKVSDIDVCQKNEVKNKGLVDILMSCTFCYRKLCKCSLQSHHFPSHLPVKFSKCVQ